MELFLWIIYFATLKPHKNLVYETMFIVSNGILTAMYFVSFWAIANGVRT